MSLLASVIIARVLGPEGKGAYTLVVLVYTMAVTIAGFGMPIANTYHVGKGKYLPNELLVNSFWTALLGAFGLGVVYLLFVRMRPAFLTDIDYRYLAVAFALAPLGLLTQSFSGVLQGLNRIWDFNVAKIVFALCNVMLLVPCTLLLRMGLRGALLAWASSIVVSLATAFWYLRRYASLDLKPRARVFRESTGFGTKAWIAQLIGISNFRLDFFLVAHFLGAPAVGVYSVAVSLSEMVYYFPGALAIAAFPRLTHAAAPEANRLAVTACRFAGVAGIVGALGLAMAGQPVIRLLFGSAFRSAYGLLLVLLPGIAVYSVGHVTTVYFDGHLGKPLINARLAFLSLSLDILLGLFLIPRIGLVGAALASSIAYTVTMVATLGVFLRTSRLAPSDVFIVRGEVETGMRWARTVFAKLYKIYVGLGERFER